MGLGNLKCLDGRVEKIIFRNDDNGYTVAEFKTDGGSITVVGNLLSAREGDFAKLEGEFVTHPRYDKQFKINKYTSVKPTGIRNIEIFLASGFITGIGPEIAKEVVKTFGNKTMDIIENDIDRLVEVKGIAYKKLEMIKKSWEEHKKIKDLVFFLQEHDISNYLATKIYSVYREQSIPKIKENPYVLVKDIRGVGFLTADKIAMKLGFPLNSVFRAEAACIHVMLKSLDEGHCYLPYNDVISNVNKLIDIPIDTIEKSLVSLEDDNKIIVDSGDDGDNVYLLSHYKYELTAAIYVSKLLKQSNHPITIKADKEIKKLEKIYNIEFDEIQKEAIAAGLTKKMLIISGGPGTGKTTIINSIIDLTRKHSNKLINLAAPTGKAAKRMSEVTGMDAQTIHRLLEYDGALKTFARNEYNPIACDLLIIDEMSMTDMHLFYSLIKSVPMHASVIFVGDIDQLPSVGAGNVLRELIQSGKILTVFLTKIFRQAEESLIIVNSHRINRGEFPFYENQNGKTDFFFIEKNDPIDARKTIIDFVVNRLPKQFGLDPLNDIQVLSPMYKGEIGVNTLNRELQSVLNKQYTSRKYQRDFVTFLEGDKVMQIRNNYDKEVFNGDVGTIVAIYPEDKYLTINFDGIDIQYTFGEMDEIVLAYAATIHKSQGSEFPAVVMPMTMQHFILLQRNLLYTGITRGKKYVVIVGEKKAMAMAIKNNTARVRYTRLAEKIGVEYGDSR